MTLRRGVIALAIFLLFPVPVRAIADGGAPDLPGIRAIDAAFSRGGEAAVADIVPFLRERDLAVRNHAMLRLVEIGEPAVDRLLSALSDENARWFASGALLNIGAPAVRKTVLAVRDPDPAVRRGALFILQQLEVVSAAPSIQGALSDPDPSVQVQAIRAMAHFRGEGALRLILAKVESPNTTVRDVAIDSLARFGPDAEPFLRTLYRQGSDETRASSVRAMGAVGTHAALGLVRSALKDRSVLVRYYACRALGEAGDVASGPALVEMLSDPDPTVREAAEEACARMPETVERQLLALLKEGTVLQKIEAANVARKAAYRPAVPLLIDLMRDPSHEVCLSAAAALMVIADPSSVEALVDGLADSKTRWVCVVALRQQGKASVRSLLRRTGDAELDYWKQYVLEGMEEGAVEGLVDALTKGGDLGVRNVALCTLQQIRDARAVYPIVRMMGDPQVGRLAVFLASKMWPAAVEPLLMSLKDGNPVVRAGAVEALAAMRESRAEAPLREMLKDPDPVVREAAEKGLGAFEGNEPAAGGGVRPPS